MKNLKKFLALGIAAVMAIGVTACGGGSSSSANATNSAGGETKGDNTTGGKRDLTIGSWYVQYYDSSHTSLEDDPNYAGDLASELKFNNVKKIEEKYNVTLKWVNLTYTGTLLQGFGNR